MFKPFNILLILLGAYLIFPMLGFGVFPEYFDFVTSFKHIFILAIYVFTTLSTCYLAKKVEHHYRTAKNKLQSGNITEKWGGRSIETRAKISLTVIGLFAGVLGLMVIGAAGSLNDGFSPHEFRMGVASSGDLKLIVAYNFFCLIALINTNLAIVSLEKSSKKTWVLIIIVFQVGLLILTGQRGLLILALFSHLFLNSLSAKPYSKLNITFALVAGLLLVLFLGVIRQGDSIEYFAFLWQLSVRFDLFYPQFFNFIDAYDNLKDIGYGYYHFTFPAQIIPSAIWTDKPITFLQFVNRDLMNIADGTGNDFTAYAEFIYNYGVLLGMFFYATHCFFVSLIIYRIYRLAKENIVHFVVYSHALTMYLSLILLTGISNQAHFFSIIGILVALIVCKAFVHAISRKSKDGVKFSQSRHA